MFSNALTTYSTESIISDEAKEGEEEALYLNETISILPAAGTSSSGPESKAKLLWKALHVCVCDFQEVENFYIQLVFKGRTFRLFS